jgi:nucleoside-diphosphate-sugar epimerase
VETADTGPAGISRVVVVGGRSRAAIAFRRLVARTRPFALTVLVRQPDTALPGEQVVVVEDYFSPPDKVFAGADALVNFAGIPDNRPEPELVAVNVQGPQRLARKARASAIQHMVQISSLHIYGAPTRVDRFTLEAPLSAYARSKQAGDVALSALGSEDFHITLLRMPMHYGPTAGKKLRTLVRIVTRLGWFPVPQAPVRRSMVHLDNLATAIMTVLQRRLDGIQFVADAELFGYEILRDALRHHTGKAIRLVRLPDVFFLPMRVLAPGIYRRLYQDNVIAPELVLQPESGYPVSMATGLKDVLR